MVPSPELRDMVLTGASALTIERGGMQHGMETLHMSGLNKLQEGMTTVEEIVHVTSKDECVRRGWQAPFMPPTQTSG
jgi:type IV pilus assembly protein PilB